MKPLYTQEQFDNAKTKDKLPCECSICFQAFYKSKKQINELLKGRKNYSAKYCSKICQNKSQITSIKLNCLLCSKEFYKMPAEIKKTKSGHHFCSRSCATTYNNQHKTAGNRRSKLEIWLESKLITLYPDHKILFNDKTTINSELDIYFVDLKLAFELNGLFHYEPIYGKDKLDQIQNNDNRKFQACLEQGIELCIIDSSSLKYFKESNCIKYFDLITNVINQKGFNVSKNISL